MPKFLLLTTLLILSQPSHAESWFDSALDFFGFGDDETTETPAPVSEPEPVTKTLTDAAIDVSTSSAATSSLTDMVVSQLGVTESQAKGGLGTLFGLAQANLGEADFSSLSSAVPEMGALLSAAPAVSEGTEGLTSLMGNAGKYAQALQSTTRAYSQFKSLGLGVDQIPGYIDVTNEFLESQGNPDAMTLFQQGVGKLLSAEE